MVKASIGFSSGLSVIVLSFVRCGVIALHPKSPLKAGWVGLFESYKSSVSGSFPVDFKARPALASDEPSTVRQLITTNSITPDTARRVVSNDFGKREKRNNHKRLRSFGAASLPHMSIIFTDCACRQILFNDKTNKMQKDFKMCSLFSGIGGLELGLEAAVPGLRTCWQVEQDGFCRQVLKKHWPDAERFEDVRAVELEDIRGADVICGGFPCQDISVAGKGAGLAGERSGLWWEMHRLIGLALPRVVVAENVPALTSRGLSEVLSSLVECGYTCEWDTISAAAVGAVHRRDRLFIVAWRNDANPDSGKGRQCLKRGEEKGRKASGGSGERLSDKNATNPNGAFLREQSRRGGGASRAGSSLAGQLGKARRLELNPWQALGGVCPVDDGIPGRVARLRALGNAVVPQVAYQVGLRVNQILKEMNYE